MAPQRKDPAPSVYRLPRHRVDSIDSGAKATNDSRKNLMPPEKFTELDQRFLATRHLPLNRLLHQYIVAYWSQ